MFPPPVPEKIQNIDRFEQSSEMKRALKTVRELKSQN